MQIKTLVGHDDVRVGSALVALGQAAAAQQRFREALAYREEWSALDRKQPVVLDMLDAHVPVAHILRSLPETSEMECETMPRGVKEGSKRERQYEHIKEGYEHRGVSKGEAEERAARTVNKVRSEHGETKSQRSRKTK